MTRQTALSCAATSVPVRSLEGLTLVAGIDGCAEARDAAAERWGSDSAWLTDICELSNGAGGDHCALHAAERAPRACRTGSREAAQAADRGKAARGELGRGAGYRCRGGRDHAEG